MIYNRPKVYIAGPLFSAGERGWNVTVRQHLEHHCEVYLPQDDGALLVDLVSQGVPVAVAKHTIFSYDIAAIENCHIILIIMDGRVIDEGACFELGFAFAKGKVCIGLKTDPRSLLPIGDNPMVSCSIRRVFTQVEEVLGWIEAKGWETD